MKRYMTKQEIAEAKSDKNIRERIRRDLEEWAGAGKIFFPEVQRREASAIDIKRYCDAIGDLNPLYRSVEYASNSIRGGITAPPHFINAICWTGLSPGVPVYLIYPIALAGYEAGNITRWFKTIREGDRFVVYDQNIHITDITREHTALQFLKRGDRVYKNQRDEIVCIATGSGIQVFLEAPEEENAPGKVSRAWEQYKPYHFSEQEIMDWYQRMEQEPIRGAEVRYWEDVKIGEQLPPVHHVFTLMENATIQAGAAYGGVSWRLRMHRALSGVGNVDWQKQCDPESGVPDFSNLHDSDKGALHAGLPVANAMGAHLKLWIGHLLTNWMGDAGFLKKVEDRVRRFLWKDQFCIVKGTVTNKYVDEDEHLVDISITLEDHFGNFIIPDASATVALPSQHREI